MAQSKAPHLRGEPLCAVVERVQRREERDPLKHDVRDHQEEEGEAAPQDDPGGSGAARRRGRRGAAAGGAAAGVPRMDTSEVQGKEVPERTRK